MKRQMYHRNRRQLFAGFWQRLVVVSQASIVARPRKRASHCPTPRKNNAPRPVTRPFNDFKNPLPKRFGTFNPLAGIIAAIPPLLAVLTDWLSTSAVERLAPCPSSRRTWIGYGDTCENSRKPPTTGRADDTSIAEFVGVRRWIDFSQNDSLLLRSVPME